VVVRQSDLQFGVLPKIVQAVEEAELSHDEALQLIDILRLKYKDYRQLGLPELPHGTKVQVRMGQHIKVATIDKKCGYSYTATVDGQGLLISPKEILKII
jgi:hypothetical protein